MGGMVGYSECPQPGEKTFVCWERSNLLGNGLGGWQHVNVTVRATMTVFAKYFHNAQDQVAGAKQTSPGRAFSGEGWAQLRTRWLLTRIMPNSSVTSTMLLVKVGKPSVQGWAENLLFVKKFDAAVLKLCLSGTFHLCAPKPQVCDSTPVRPLPAMSLRFFMYHITFVPLSPRFFLTQKADNSH